MSERRQRKRLERSLRTARSKQGRAWLGEDSWLEIASKLITIATLLFGVFTFFYNIEPLLGKLRAERQRAAKQEQQLQAQRDLVRKLKIETAILNRQRSTLQRQLEQYQKTPSGMVLSNLVVIKREVQEAVANQRRFTEPFDLRKYLIAYTEAQLKGSPESFRKEALDFFRKFVEQNIPPNSTDVRPLDRLLDAYEQQRHASTPGQP
jgi:hypothetical protein